MNFKIIWLSECGYTIIESNREVDDCEVFRLFSEAKANAIQRAENEVSNAKRLLKNIKNLKKSDL